MKLLYVLAGLLLTYATIPSNGAPTPSTRNKYIVKLKKGAPQANFRSLLNKNNFAAENKIKYSYKPSFFNGFAGEFTNDFLQAFSDQHGEDLEYVELDGTVKAFGSQKGAPSWGLVRTSQRKLDLSADYTYPETAGNGVTVYVVDTGIQFDQADFGGRAKLDTSIVKGETAPDGNGHGTHCSGTIGSATYGIAKNVQIRGVKVLNGQGSGQLSDVVAGMQYVAGKATKDRISVVMSMSLGGPKTQSLDDAADAAVDAGVVAVVAAGNDNKDACNVSPAGAKKVITVGATDKNDSKASFSNFGRCIEIWAPGVGITSLWKGASGATNTISGTSMATPHVAGVVALFLAEKNYKTVDELKKDLFASATPGVITGLDSASPNLLLYNKNEPAGPAPPPGPPSPPSPPSPPTPPPPPPSDDCPDSVPPEKCDLYKQCIAIGFPPQLCQILVGGQGGPGGPGSPGDDECPDGIPPQLCDILKNPGGLKAKKQ